MKHYILSKKCRDNLTIETYQYVNTCKYWEEFFGLKIEFLKKKGIVKRWKNQ